MVQPLSQYILSLDENVLGVCLMDANYRMVESALKTEFNSRFSLTSKLKEEASAYAAAIFGTAQLVEESFGETNYVVVDYSNIKLMLLKLLPERQFVGLIVNRSTNIDYIAMKSKAKIGWE